MLSLISLLLLSLIANVWAASPSGGVLVSDEGGRRVCTVFARGEEQNDVPNILQAFEKCGQDSTVIFPEDQTYWIGEKLHATLHNVDIQWKGEWQVCLLLSCCQSQSPVDTLT